VLREVMAAGYKPSVPGSTTPATGASTSLHFAGKDDCVLLFMAEGPAGSPQATAEGIDEIAGRFDGLMPIDSELIRSWFENLTWGLDKIAAGGRAHPHDPQCQSHDEVSADWSSIHEIYEAAIRADPN
jgi:hypothetical protein